MARAFLAQDRVHQGGFSFSKAVFLTPTSSSHHICHFLVLSKTCSSILTCSSSLSGKMPNFSHPALPSPSQHAKICNSLIVSSLLSCDNWVVHQEILYLIWSGGRPPHRKMRSLMTITYIVLEQQQQQQQPTCQQHEICAHKGLRQNTWGSLISTIF